jgi:predicted  nucleic acid-binding Zn-ribbon protein
LRIIKGPVAEWDKLNRNKRKYSEKLWDKVLSSPYVQEQLRYKTLYGEANHPTDRYEVEFSKVSHSIVEMWKVPASSQIYATIYILDTPLGRILNTLYEAGGILGYSSRAGGTLTPRKGYVDVDEDSYNFVTFDAVPFPSVESARPPIVEGKVVEVDKKTLPDDVHDKLCKIISESSSESWEAVKDLIYNLKGYDLTKEMNLLEEGSTSNSVKDDSTREETTMSLLKESSLQIDRLKSTNQILQSAKVSLEAENKNLKENLNSSLGNITRLVAESEDMKSLIHESESKFNDTIKGLKVQIQELRGDIEDRDLEIERLESVQEAFKAVQIENKRLKSDVTSVKESADASISLETAKMKKELEDVYKEISSLISESANKDSKISELLESVKEAEKKLQESESIREGLVRESSKIDESVRISDALQAENERLKREISGLNESVSSIEEKAESYKEDLISVICSGYNLTVESVKEKLPVGFTKSDIYCVCESVSNSFKRGLNYSNVISESVQADERKEVNKPCPKVPFIDRRGRGIS